MTIKKTNELTVGDIIRSPHFERARYYNGRDAPRIVESAENAQKYFHQPDQAAGQATYVVYHVSDGRLKSCGIRDISAVRVNSPDLSLEKLIDGERVYFWAPTVPEVELVGQLRLETQLNA